ncbi:toxin-antitoxin system HicB family antitoxin, partial [Streptomyces sp. 15-116A]|uniref:toxin-antitoxin system HicB family antitoxin n=1 Tax=Streptomyces sp. 15-116A TaxID=2259035 RepID=UPI0021B31FDB
PPEWDAHPVARVSLRLPEPLKNRAEQAAARQGISLNAWLVALTHTHLERSAPAPALIRTTVQGEP